MFVLASHWLGSIYLFVAKSTGYVEVNGDNVCSSTPSESRGWVIGPIHSQCLTLFQEGMAASFQGSWAREQRSYDKVCAITHKTVRSVESCGLGKSFHFIIFPGPTWLKQQQFIFSQSWFPEVHNQSAGKVGRCTGF